MPPQIFKNRVIATAGPLPGQLTIENLKRWTEYRRGRFSNEFNEDVTHLLCTREQFRKRVPRVKAALCLVKGKAKDRKLHIVHCDWFEVSAVHNRKLPEDEYSMRQREAERKAAEREERRIERGKANGEKFVNTNYYHIYRDREFFPYQIELIQYDQETGNPAYKYTLCLWESNAKPHLHWFTAKLLDKNPGKANVSKYHRGSTHAVKWRTAFDQFASMFEKLCKYPWEDRVTRQATVPTAFQYLPPTGGKPLGRRLRHPQDYCLEINASLRGLPWPPVKHVEQDSVAGNDDANELLIEERLDDEMEDLQVPSAEDEDNQMETSQYPDPKEITNEDDGETVSEVESSEDEHQDRRMEVISQEHDQTKEDRLSDADSGVDVSRADEAMADSE